MIMGAVMFGHGKTRCGVILEPSAQHVIDPRDRAELLRFIELVWYVRLTNSIDMPYCF